MLKKIEKDKLCSESTSSTMKYLHAYIKITFFSLLLLTMGCATTGSGGVKSEGSKRSTSDSNSNTVNIVESSSDSITDYLRRIAGVEVVGDGPNAQIKIRGKSSFMSDTTPLFVVNGIRAGKNFSSIYSMLNPSDIVRIEVLKGTDTSMYGMDGANGVIVISTKN